MIVMEHTLICSLCGHVEHWTTEAAAQIAGVWHVYDEHRGEWISIAGDRLPRGVRQPEAFGRRLATRDS